MNRTHQSLFPRSKDTHHADAILSIHKDAFLFHFGSREQYLWQAFGNCYRLRAYKVVFQGKGRDGSLD